MGRLPCWGQEDGNKEHSSPQAHVGDSGREVTTPHLVIDSKSPLLFSSQKPLAHIKCTDGKTEATEGKHLPASQNEFIVDLTQELKVLIPSMEICP